GGWRDGAHVDLDLGLGAGRVELDDAGFDSVVGEDSDGGGGGVLMVLGCDMEGDAAQSVSAHLGAGAIGVEDDHAGVGVGFWRDEEDSVGADAVVTVAVLLDEVWGEGIGMGFEQEEVVAESVVLGESVGHGDVCRLV
ncbi:MAG: hypothetical protein U1E22_10600, partial [Coriobacteriia bacterium]|nr:hypothetical protein [Coriobacteriia bacterium]